MGAKRLPPMQTHPAAWWDAYVERIATDPIFQKKVRKIVATRHENAARVTSEELQGRSPFGAYALGLRRWLNWKAERLWPSPDPFEDGWKPTRNLGPVETLSFKVGSAKDWPAF